MNWKVFFRNLMKDQTLLPMLSTAAAAFLAHLFVSRAVMTDLSSLLYIAVILLWALSLQRRIVDTAIREYLLAACFFMGLLFVLRIMRYTYFADLPAVSRQLWYAYYIPMTAVPLLVFLAAMQIGEVDAGGNGAGNIRLGKPKADGAGSAVEGAGSAVEGAGSAVKGVGAAVKGAGSAVKGAGSGSPDMYRRIGENWRRNVEVILLLLEMLLSLLMVTNFLHGWAFHETAFPDEIETRGWLYYACVIWILAFGMGAVIVMFRKCRISAARNQWYIPAVMILAGSMLLVLYYLEGGALELFGHKLYNLQEAYCFLFIAACESLIRIGLMPANDGYDELFAVSHIRAAIRDRHGNTVIRSSGYGVVEPSAWLKYSEMPISGGSAVYAEDVTAVYRLDEEIRARTEELNDENDLIRQEKEILEERIGYETQNRLYERIRLRTRGQSEQIVRELGILRDKRALKDRMPFLMLLGAYVKRMGNLMLIADEERVISTEELMLAIRESFEYLSLAGITCDLVEKERREIPSGTAILCYELFEAALEECFEDVHTVQVTIGAGQNLSDPVQNLSDPQPRRPAAMTACLIEIALDCKKLPSFDGRSYAQSGVKPVVFTRDDTVYVQLEMPWQEVPV